ncbi:MAG: hypothetical protein K0U86_00435 [Planctomycetes bacterium]|nr:hypothetical protein [Planctomycetota bacterium]MCH9723353.1 hypothetical protein [Planctomycetota bacterium]MCH9779072.1 hypothetical protein [Planctomycetota bacterium]MCH9792110.1 hypothetical protein [Planctomycetota bacterium]
MSGIRTILCGILILAVGCGGVSDAPDRRIVTGTVTLDGVPVEGAAIRFLPQPTGPIAAGKVIDGKYEVTNKGGVPLGKHRVEIKGIPILPADTKGMSLGEIDAATRPPVPIPEKYFKNSKLEATIEAGSGPHTVNFELKKESD